MGESCSDNVERVSLLEIALEYQVFSFSWRFFAFGTLDLCLSLQCFLRSASSLKQVDGGGSGHSGHRLIVQISRILQVSAIHLHSLAYVFL